MGFVCTLHVIDEDLIRNKFEPRYLCKIECTSPFD
jgi:hypothetical protein